MRPVLAVLLCVLAGIAAEEPIPGLTADALGRLRAGPISLQLVHFSKDWRPVDQGALRVAAGSPSRSDGAWRLRGTWPTQAGGDFAVDQTLRVVGPQRLAYEVHLRADPGLETNALALTLSLPVDAFAGRAVLLDGKPLVLPADLPQAKDSGLFDGTVASLRIPGQDGTLTITGPLRIHAQDDRVYGGSTYSIRLGLATGLVTAADLAVEIAVAPYVAHPVDLSAAANVGWSDPVADDRAGGWTDQGPQNDLSAMKPGTQRLANVPFTLLDEQAAQGRSAIVLAGGQRDHFPKEATVRLADPGDRHLYLLQACAWAPPAGTAVGRLRVRYADGEEAVFPMTAGRDLADWWSPHGLDNGVVAWTADNRSAYVGLYCTHVGLAKAVDAIRLESTGTGVWMVAAMTSAPEPIPLPKDGPVFIVAGEGWRPVTSGIDVEAGGILDFSSLVDAPAGKHGAVVVRDGHFALADGGRVRFYGTNFCFSANFPSHAESEAIATRMAREGYNSVRLHHYDWDLTAKEDKTDSTAIDPAQRDRFDYLIHCLEQRGIYISIDLYTFRRSLPHEIPEVGAELRGGGYKAAVVLLDSAMANWQRFARNVMLPVNPYTGRSLAADPALAGLCPINEDTLWVAVNDDPRLLAIARERFAAWLPANGGEPADDAARQRRWLRFLTGRQIAANQAMAAFLRGLGVRAPLTGINFITTQDLVPIRADASFDYVDNHSYWDHPGFPERDWSLPHSYGNRSATAAGAQVPRDLLAGRVIGKPYTITEFNYTCPNRFRAEGGPLMGAYAALQDWDGLWRFATAHNLQNLVSLRPASGFDLGADPLSRLSERLGLLCFLRGDVAPARGQVALVVDEATAWAGGSGWGRNLFPDGFPWLGLHTRIGSAWKTAPAGALILGPAGIAAPAGGRVLVPEADLLAQLAREGAIPAGAVDVARKAVTSDTGEVRLAGGEGRFQVVTPRSECAVLTGAGTATGTVATVINAGEPVTVGVAAMDGKPLATCGRVLVLHLTDLQNTRTKYRGTALTLLDAWGDLPHLVRAGKLELRLVLAGEWVAWACDLAGHRLREVPLTRDGASLVLLSDQTAGEEPVLVYDLQRK